MEKYFITGIFALLFAVTLASANAANTPTTGTNKSGTAGDTSSTGEASKSGTISPTQESISACSGKNAGASCTFTGPNDLTTTGTCTKPTKTSALACRESSSDTMTR